MHPRNSPGGQSHVPGVGKPGLDRCPRSLGAALAGHCRTQGPSDLLADTGLVRELCLAVFCAKVDSKPCVWKVRSWDHWHQIAGERQKVSGLGPVVWLLISNWSLIRCARYPKNRLGTAPGSARITGPACEEAGPPGLARPRWPQRPRPQWWSTPLHCRQRGRRAPGRWEPPLGLGPLAFCPVWTPWRPAHSELGSRSDGDPAPHPARDFEMPFPDP